MKQNAAFKVDEIGDISRIYARHKKLFYLTLVTVVVASVITAFSLPPVYRSSATILIEGQEMPGKMVRSTVSGRLESRLEVVQMRVMTEANIDSLIEEFNLYPSQRLQEELQVTRMRVRESATRELNRLEVSNPNNNKLMPVTVSFSLAFDDSEPATSFAVTTRLVELYIFEHNKMRKEQANKISTFLAGEAEKISAKIIEIEDRLAAFKQQHVSALPQTAEMNMRLLEQAQTESSRLSDNLKMLDERKRNLLAQLEYDAYKKGAYATGDDIILGADKKLLIQKARLSELRSRYSAVHPEVLRLKNEITELEREASSPPQGASTSASTAAYSLYESVYQKQLSELNADIQQERAAIRQVKAKISTYEGRLFQSPIVERDFLKLNRDRENAMVTYNDLKDRHMEAQIAEQMEIEDRAERLSIVEPASLPASPHQPNRVGIFLLGAVLALGLGVGAVAFADLRDGSVHGSHGVQSALGIPVIAVIPNIESTNDSVGLSFKTAAVVALLLVGAAALTLHFRPQIESVMPAAAQSAATDRGPLNGQHRSRQSLQLTDG